MSLDFRSTLLAAGLLPRDVAPDGRWHRCPTEHKPKKRNGSWKLLPDGRTGFYCDWALDSTVQVWHADDAAPVRQVDHAAIRAQREREWQARVKATQGAREFWRGAQAIREPHPYIAGKRLSQLGCSKLRVREGLLVVPAWRDPWLVSVQTISAAGDKRFWPGASIKAGAYVLQRRRAAVTVFCEGLATGLAVFQSVPLARVVVCFNTGNMLPVIEHMKPSGGAVIAADNDHDTEDRTGVNPGLEAARCAAEALGVGVAYPQGIGGSDWADALAEWMEEPDPLTGRPGRTPHALIQRAILAKAALVRRPEEGGA